MPAEARQEIEAILSAFRQWLLEAEQWRYAVAAPSEHAKEEGTVDLHTLLGELTALKQEVRLEARGSKTARAELDRAVQAFERASDEARQQNEQSLGPLVRERDRLRDDLTGRIESQERDWVELILDIREALARGEASSTRAGNRLGWRRWFVPRGLIESLREGHALSLRRIDATLEARGVQRIECVGQRVDPQRMRVVDVVDNAELPEGQVTEVVRDGYTCGSRVIRYAEVRAAARGRKG